MEETVWLYFSILAVLVGFAVIASLVYNSSGDAGYEHVLRSLDEMKNQCDYVCHSGVGTNLPVIVTLPSGMYLYTRSAKICAILSDKNACRVCDCDLASYEMSLNTSFALKAFKTHDFNCYFEKKEKSVGINCQG